ncbi:ferric-dicitrate binding protein FerR (iron transport regulator) [Chitinophaga terrae (ex Kim and Jung 2007)]|uniref:FecR family protein n=1 Tax=Chitinophaga terrae (ex Kim and Jung 2007) TaxID=408074 RepID=UPI002789D3BA|nr:FecR family protein [Chitinophaga terrae (ex Kim and Jung 2007)]MDQ0106571.1 ferric-dicitrate binding protein FerR (iron transport regulator) [Chitinophaga terrae (ex Kim and Jung 2007)]
MPGERIKYLLEAYFQGTASDQEVNELMQLIDQDGNDESVNQMLDSLWNNFAPGGQVWPDAKKSELFANIKARTALQQPPIVRRLRTWHWVAAAAVAGIIATIVFYPRPNKISAPSIMAAAQHTDISPGKDRAILTLQDGTKLDLDSLQDSNATAYGFSKQHNEIVFSPADQQIAYNTLTTPKGGKYRLTLPDGSKVWINAASSIRFPTAFEGKSREVTLTGEAYFEIAPNATQAFHVKVKDMDVQVLGTHFNVMAYDDEASINTTLLEGAVKVSRGSQSHILKPGQQSVSDNQGRLSINAADIEEVMAWKNDQFIFKACDFATVMRQIARWYDVSVIYKGKVPEGKYSGIIGRNNNISQVLNILRASGVSFEISNNTIIVE